ncbi:ANTAR domain-containing protein [Amycolatopsis sp. NPDC023774]
MASQPVIEQAKGMLMLLRNCSADEAFDALRKAS